MSAVSLAMNVRTWIFAALVIGFIFGDIGGEYDAILLIVFLMIMMCFSLTKLDISKKDFAAYRRQITVGLFLSSFVSTAVTLCVGLCYNRTMWPGWVMLACVPCAIACISGTFIMKGDGKLVTLSETAIYIVSVILTPILTFLLINEAVDPLEILKYVLLFIAVPFIVSFPLKKMAIPNNAVTLVLNISFFMLTLIAIGKSRDIILSDLWMSFLILCGTAIRMPTVHLMIECILKHKGICKEKRIPYSLLGIWKNSGLALALTMMIFPGNDSALAPIAISMVFEQIYFMFIIHFYQKDPTSTATYSDIQE